MTQTQELALGGMGRYFLHDGPLFFEVREKETLLRSEESEWASVLSRLDGLAASDTIKASFERFVNGELTIKELNTAIDEELNLTGKGVRGSENEGS